jgi:glycine cleavage system H protein
MNAFPKPPPLPGYSRITRNDMDPKTLRYSKSHEWAHLEGDVCTIGLTKFAVDQLTDIVYVDLPDMDDPVVAGEGFGEIESVKAVSDLYSPVTGDVVEINDKLETDPTLISNDPYGKGWLIKVKVESGTNLNHLMTLEQYEKQIASEEH